MHCLKTAQITPKKDIYTKIYNLDQKQENKAVKSLSSKIFKVVKFN